MKHRLRAPSGALVISLIALFVALGSGTAWASRLISGSQIKNHSIAAKKLTKSAVKTLRGQRGRAGPAGATGRTGAAGPAGAAGHAGPPGAPGSPGFVSVGGFGGLVGVIGAFQGLQFAGPVTTLTITASQSIVASGSSALGTSGATVTAIFGVCVSPTGAGKPVPLNSKIISVAVTSTRVSYAASATGAPGAGTWDVGMCADATGPIADNDRSMGYAFVANGTPVSAAPTNKSSHRG